MCQDSRLTQEMALILAGGAQLWHSGPQNVLGGGVGKAQMGFSDSDASRPHPTYGQSSSWFLSLFQ